ncbi:MAG: efflux RND transporter periplasmic adaptor subunit [Patescibacteria group bacterium]
MKIFSKKNLVIGTVLLAVGAGVWWYLESKKEAEDVPTEEVKRGVVVETVSVTGELLHEEYADLSFLTLGTVESVDASIGDRVTEGQKLITLDSPALESELNAARIALSIAEENEKLARRTWHSLRPEAREAKKLATEQARETLRGAMSQMKNSVITSPLEGFLSKLDVRVGETVTAGKVIARVAKDSGFEIEARVPESDIAKLEKGMRARVTFDSLSDNEIFDAEVIDIDPASTVVQDVVSYKVTFRFPSTDERLKEGMTVNIDVETSKKEGVLVVPFRALTELNGVTYAEIKGTDGKLTKVEVVTGLEGDEGEVEVISGLSEGDRITLGAKQKN